MATTIMIIFFLLLAVTLLPMLGKSHTEHRTDLMAGDEGDD